MSFVARTHPQQGPNEKVDDRETTPEVFTELNNRLGPFQLDAAASPHNAKCQRFYTKEDNGLLQPWDARTWCNPPYSNIRPWVEKAWDESRRGHGIVMLVPANRTEQAWWQDLVEPRRRKGSPFAVEFIRGRMRFIAAGDDKIKPNARPPFGVCLLKWLPLTTGGDA